MDVVAFVVFLALAVMIGNAMLGGVVQLAIAVLFWMVAGNVAGHIIRGEDYGVMGNIALGLLGGIVGTVTLRVIGLGGVTVIPLVGSLIAGVFGAVIFVYLMRILGDSNFGR